MIGTSGLNVSQYALKTNGSLIVENVIVEMMLTDNTLLTIIIRAGLALGLMNITATAAMNSQMKTSTISIYLVHDALNHVETV